MENDGARIRACTFRFRSWVYGVALLLAGFLVVTGCSFLRNNPAADITDTEVDPGTGPGDDPEQEPVVTIEAVADGVAEGEEVSFTVTAMPPPAADLVVRVTVTETGDTLPASVPENVTIAAGQTSATLQVTTVDDTASESDSTVTATLTAGTGYTLGSSSSATVTVTDNDQPQVTIAADGDPVTEGEAVSFTVTAMPPPTADLVVRVTVTETGDTLPASVPENVTIAAGLTTETLQVTTVDDTASESDSTVTATLTAGTGYTLGSSSSATVTVTDNDQPQVTIAADGDRVTEGGAVSFTVTAMPPPAADLVVRVTVSETGDTLPASVPENVTIAAGLTTETLQVTTVDDTASESDSTVTATLTAGTGYTIGSSSSAAVTVTDNDQPQVTIAADGDRVTEGEAVSFTVTAMPPPAADLVVRVTVTETEDTLPASVPENVTIAAGQTTATLQVPTVDDTADEPDSTVTATLTAGTGYTLGSTSSAEVTVADNDTRASPPPRPLPPATPELPHVTIAAGQARVTEGQSVEFTVRANPAPSTNKVVSVTVTETGDTGVAGTRTMTIGAGTTSAALSISTVDDTTDEPDSRVTATVNRGTGYTVARPSSARVTVADNDATAQPPDGDDDPSPGGKPTVSITRVSTSAVTEGDFVDVTLTADPVPTEPIGGGVIFRDSDSAIGTERVSYRFDRGETTAQTFYGAQHDGVDVPSRTLTIWLATPDDSHVVSSGRRTVTINDGDD